MKSLSSKNLEKDSESDMFDPDETDVTEFQANKPKRKHLKRQSEDTQNTPSEASQSLLMVKKKKYTEISGELGLDNYETRIKKKKRVTDDFLKQESFKQPSSENCVNSTRKKKKNKYQNNKSSDDSDCTISRKKIKQEKELSSPPLEEATKKKKKKEGWLHLSLSENDKTVEFGAQELFKQPSSEDFMNSTPRKSKKNKNKDLNINLSDDSDILPIKKELSSPTNHTLELPSSDHVTKKDKKLNGLNLSEDDNTMNFGAQELFKQPSSEDFVNSPLRKTKKKKNKDSNINFSDDSNSTVSSINKIKTELNSPINHTHELSAHDYVTKKDKKKNVSGLNLSNLSEDDNNIYFGAQELFKEPNYDNSMTSPLRKSKKKKSKASNIYFTDDSDNTISLESNSPLKHTLESLSSEDVTKKDKKKKMNGLNLSNLSQEDSTIEFGSQNIFKQLPSSEEIVNPTSKKFKKKKQQLEDGKDSGDNLTLLVNDDLAKKGKKKRNKESIGLNQIDTAENSTFGFCTQDIFELPDSEDYVNSTPKKKHKKKKKTKESEETGSDIRDSKKFPIKEMNYSNVTIDDGNLTEPFTKKVMEKRNNGQNLNETSPDSNTLKYADNFDNCLSPDSTETVKLHHSFNISSDNSQVFSELEDSEIDIPCKKHKKKKHKEPVSNNISEDNIPGIKSNHFFCQFCISSVNNIRKNGSETLGNEDILENSGRNGLEKRENKIKKKKRTTSVNGSASGKTNGVLDLLDKYLDNEETWVDDDNSPVTEANNHPSSSADNNIQAHLPDFDRTTFIIDKGDVEQTDNEKIDIKQENAENSEASLNNTLEDGHNDILDSPLDTRPDNDNNNDDQDILGVNRVANLSDSEIVDIENNNPLKKKRGKRKKSLHQNLENEVIDDNDDDNGQDMFDVDGYNSKSGENSTLSQKKAAKKKYTTKHKDPIDVNIEDSQSTPEHETNVSLENSSLVRRTSESSSVSIGIGDNVDQSGSKRDGSESDAESMSTQKKIPKRKIKRKSEDSQSTSDNDTNSSRNISKLGQQFSESSDVSLNLDDDLEPSGDNSLTKNTKSKNTSGDRSRSSSESSNGNDAHFDDSDSEVDRLDKTEVIKARLESLTINIDFPVPELHKICNRASKPTPQQRMEAARKNIPIKLGKFVKAEDDKIIDNWKRFIQVHDFEDTPSMFFSLGKKFISGKEKQKFLYFISRGFDERPPFYVYRRFKLLMASFKGGKFTQEEDEYILRQVEESQCYRNYIADIAQHLKRPFHSVEKRIKRLKERHTRKIRWKKSNLVAFIKYLLKATNTDPDDIEALKNKHITSQQWARLSKKLDGVPIRILKPAWLDNIHPMLFIPGECCDLKEVRLKLIRMLRENKEYDWRAVDWSSYASHFDGLTGSKLYHMIKTLVVHKVPLEKRKNLKDCIKILSKLKKENLGKNMFIYKIKYQDGKVIQLGSTEKKIKTK